MVLGFRWLAFSSMTKVGIGDLSCLCLDIVVTPFRQLRGSLSGQPIQDRQAQAGKLKLPLGKCIHPNKWPQGKKYLLRLINAATDTAFIFSIDEHKMKVIGADLVPVEPYDMESIYIGIGWSFLGSD